MSDDYEKRVAEADKTYATHQIEKQDEGRLTLRRPNEGAFWTEILLGGAGTLIVHGDAPDIMFRSWRWKESLEDLIYWVGHSEAGYIGGKVVMGKKYRFDTDEAMKELREHADDLDGDCEYALREKAAISDFLEEALWEEDNEASFHDAAGDALGAHDIHELFPFGHVVDQNFILAQAACRRAAELLKGGE